MADRERGAGAGDASRLMTCEACSVYPLSYRFGVTVNASEKQPLLD